MDKKLLIAAVVAGLLVAGGLGFAVMRGSAPPTPVEEATMRTGAQLADERPPDAGAGQASDQQAHSTE